MNINSDLTCCTLLHRIH